MKFNCRHCELAYKRIAQRAKNNNIDISHPYIDKISKETKSSRILSLIERAYYLGIARGILTVDSGHNKIVLDTLGEVK